MLRQRDVAWQATSSYQRKAHLFRSLLILAAFLAYVTCLEGGSPQCVPTKPLHHVTLRGGIAAGDYVKMGTVISPNACGNICCKDTKCDVAFMANNICYNLHCYSAKLCETRPAQETRFVVSVTYVKRGVGNEGRSVLDGISQAKDNFTKIIEKSNDTLISQKSGRNVTKQEKNLLTFYNNTRATTSNSKRTNGSLINGPLINGPSESSYVRNSTANVSASTNSTNSVKKMLHNAADSLENGTSRFGANNYTSIQRNDSVKQGNQTVESTEVANHVKTTNKSGIYQVMVAWKNDSHILVKEVKHDDATRTYLNGTGIALHGLTGEHNSTVSFHKGIAKKYIEKPQHLRVMNNTVESGNFTDNSENSTRGNFESTKGLTTKATPTNEPMTKKEKLDEELLNKSFFSLNTSMSNATNYNGSTSATKNTNDTKFSLNTSMSNATNYNGSTSATKNTNDTKFSFTSANKDVSKGKSFDSKEKGTQLDISIPFPISKNASAQQRNNGTSIVQTNSSSSEMSLSIQPMKKQTNCHTVGILYNKTLLAGLKSGDFTDYGKVQGMKNCVAYCCADHKCNIALMLGSTCYTLHCASPSLCKVRPAHPSSLNPRISFVFRNKVGQSTVKDNQGKSVASQTATQTKQVTKRVKGSRCKHGAVQHGVTLQSGQKAGIFKLRLKAKDMDSCLDMCCKDNTCNVAFLIDDSCYSVRCYSHEDCTISKAKVSRAHSSLSVVRSKILPLNDKRQQIPRAEKKYTTIINITNQLFTQSLANFESLEFLNLAERIQIAVSTVLGTFKEYKESEVISFQPSPLMTKLQLTLFDGAPIKKVLVTLVEVVKGGKMVSSIDGSVLTLLVSTSGFKFYTPEGFNLVCDPEFNYDVHWKLTVFNFQTTSPCPRKAKGETRRSCHGNDNHNATWGFPNFVNCVTSAYKTLQSKAKKFADGAKIKTPFKTLHSQIGTTPSDILIRIQKLTFVDTYRSLLDRPHNSTNTTLLHDGNNTAHDHKLAHLNSTNPKHFINTTKRLFANKTFNIPLPDTKKQVKPIPFKLVSKANSSSNARAFPSFQPHPSNASSSEKGFANVLSQTTANASSNSTLFSDIFPQAADINKFSRTNIPDPLQGKIPGQQNAITKQSNSVKQYSSNKVSYGKAPKNEKNAASSSYIKNINMLNKKLNLPFRNGFPYRYQQQQQQQQMQQQQQQAQQQPQLIETGVSNSLGYPQQPMSQFGSSQKADSGTGQIRSPYRSHYDYSKNTKNLNPQSPYAAAYRQQLQRLRASQASQSAYNKPASQSVQDWQGSQLRNNNQLGKSNVAWQKAQSWQGKQVLRGYQGTGSQNDQASFPSGIPGYGGGAFQGQPDKENARQMGIGRRRKRGIHVILKRTKRQGGNMVWYNNYKLRQPDLRSEVFRPSPAVSPEEQEPFLTNVQTGYGNPESPPNQQYPYNVDYYRPTPNYQSMTYALDKAQPSPTRATTSESQLEYNLFPTSGITDQASTRWSFPSPSIPPKGYPSGFTDLMPPKTGGIPQDLVGLGQPREDHQLPSNEPLPLPFSTTQNPFLMKQHNSQVTSSKSSPMSPLTTTQATLKPMQKERKPSPKPSMSLKPTVKPMSLKQTVKPSQSSAELLQQKLMDMARNKGAVKSSTTKHNVTVHLLNDAVYRQPNRAPMFGGDIGMIVDTLRQLWLYSQYTNPPETVDTLKQFLQVGSHIFDKRNRHEWKYLTKESPTAISALDAAEIIENYSKTVSGKLHPDDMRKPILTTNIMVSLKSIDLTTTDLSQDIQFPNYSHPSVANWTDATDKLIISPRSLVKALQGTRQKQAVQLVSCNVRRITDLLPRSLVAKTFGNNSIIGGHVMSISAIPSLGDNIDPPIKVVLNNNNKDVSNFEEKCVYWKHGSSPGTGGWSSHGCTFVESNLTHTTCECSHMSTFSAIANTAKPKAKVAVTAPPAAAPGPEEEGTNILYILLGILAVLLILFVILLIICFIIKRRKRQKESEDGNSDEQVRIGGRRSTTRSDDSTSTGSGEFDEMLASRRRNVRPENKPGPSDSPRWQRMRKNGENPDELMLKEKSYLMSDYHQPYHFLSAKSPPPTETSSQRNRSRSS